MKAFRPLCLLGLIAVMGTTAIPTPGYTYHYYQSGIEGQTGDLESATGFNDYTDTSNNTTSYSEYYDPNDDEWHLYTGGYPNGKCKSYASMSGCCHNCYTWEIHDCVTCAPISSGTIHRCCQ